jgi:two-component sensor histidine kinase
VGLAGGESSPHGSSLGLEIVQTLVVEDLKGTFSFTPGERGTQTIIHLPRPSS